MIAIVRPPGASFPSCLVQAAARPEIDLDRARDEHDAYVDALRVLGFDVRVLPPLDDLPDACFVEDVALVVPEVAVLLRPGAPERRPEVDATADAIAELRPLHRIDPPARIDGGDVLRIGRRVWVGLSSRTDAAGVEALEAALAPRGYAVSAVFVKRGLHLRTAVCEVSDEIVLAEPGAIDPDALSPARVVTAPAGGANVVGHERAVLVPTSAVRTALWAEREGFRVVRTDLSEFEKADAGATCLSLRLS